VRPAKSHRGVFGWIVIQATFMLALAGCRNAPPVAGIGPPAQSSPTVERPTPPAGERPTPPAGDRPMLIARIDTVSIYPVPGNAKDSAVSVILSVGNAGFPSTVQGWSLEVTSPGQTFTAVGPVHINGVVDAPGKLGTKIDLDKEDLAVKTARNPVARDSHVNGVLTFLLKDTRESKLPVKGTSLILHFDDSQGYSYQTSTGVISTKKKPD
jgi:hypothetical protein